MEKAGCRLYVFNPDCVMIVPLKFILIEWKRQAVVFMFLIPTVSWR